MTEPLKIDKKIVSCKVLTQEDSLENKTETEFTELLADTVTNETIKPLDSSMFDRIEALKQKAQPKRPIRLDNTWRLKPPSAEHALYVTLSAIIIEDRKYPFEIFFNTKNPEHIEWTNALTLTISNAFRTSIITGSSLESLISNLKETIGTSGTYISKVPKKPKFVNGIVAEIGYVIAEFYSECLQWNYSHSSNERKPTEEEKEAVVEYELEQMKQAVSYAKEVVEKESSKLPYTGGIAKSLSDIVTKITNPCPICGEQLTKQAGCDFCISCNYSKCG